MNKRKQDNELTVYKKAKELINYTFSITEGKKFPKKVRFVLVNRIQNLVLDIYTDLLKVNEIPLKNRKHIFISVLSNIKVVLFLVEMCLKQKYISFRQCEIWSKHCLNVKYLTAAWMKSCK